MESCVLSEWEGRQQECVSVCVSMYTRIPSKESRIKPVNVVTLTHRHLPVCLPPLLSVMVIMIMIISVFCSLQGS